MLPSVSVEVVRVEQVKLADNDRGPHQSDGGKAACACHPIAGARMSLSLSMQGKGKLDPWNIPADQSCSDIYDS